MRLPWYLKELDWYTKNGEAYVLLRANWAWVWFKRAEALMRKRMERRRGRGDA